MQRLSIRMQGAADKESDYNYKTGSTAPFCKVEAIIRPWRLNDVTQALDALGIRGITATQVSGIGAQRGDSGLVSERYKGSEFGTQKFVDKVKIEVVIVAAQVELVVECIKASVATGEVGDGKIFILPVFDVIRIRTGEKGAAAERMAGGYEDTQLKGKA